MYAQFFGLKQAPFSIAPDPRYLFMSERHREALAHLLYGVGGGGGFVVLTGEIGAGKTTVCRCFLEQIPRRTNVAYIFNPKLTVAELLKSICDEFRIPYQHEGPGTATIKDYVDPLNEFLLKTHAVGQNNVLIIDEAQNLSPDVLEQLRLLTNLETSERKLLQIMLIGQPELRTMLAAPELEQLAQRVIAHFHLDALTEEETGQYIQHRLSVAGLKRGRLFDAKAVRRIHQLSKGVPRRINLLCDRALLGAYAENKTKVDRSIVDKASQEVFPTQKAAHPSTPAAAPPPPPPPLARSRKKRQDGDWRQWVGAGLMFAAVASLGGVGWLYQQRQQGPKSAARPAGGASAAAATSSATGLAAASSAPLTKSGPHAAAGRASGPHAAGSQMSTTLSPPLADAALIQPLAWRKENQALRALAAQWRLTLAEGDVCFLAQQQDVACFRNSGGLSLVRQLERPVVLLLHDSREQAMYAVLTGLHGPDAVLQTENKTFAVPLSELGKIWRGDFVTLWRTPPGFKGKVLPGHAGPSVDWLGTQLARLDKGPVPSGKQMYDAGMRSRVYAFQMTQGLKPDGVVGATTFMQINRAIGIDEPRLQTGPLAGR
ncbi:MAG: AAA family ATPase [Aquabacterium sp.]